MYGEKNKMLELIPAFILGYFCGGVVMFLIYRNKEKKKRELNKNEQKRKRRKNINSITEN